MNNKKLRKFSPLTFIKEILGKAPKHSFKGGFFMPSHKEIAKNLREMPISKTYRLSLRTNKGWLKPIKKEGVRVLGGEIIAIPENNGDCFLHSPSSGIIKKISPQPDFFGNSALTIEIESDFKDEIFKYPPLSLKDKKELLLKRIEDCGILGLGGAGFKSARKLSKKADLLIINGAECEPYLTCDEVLMREKPKHIVFGAKIAGEIVGAKEIIIAIEDDKPLSIEAIKKEVIKEENFSLKIIPAKYPSGNTRQLVEILLNKRISPQKHLNDLGIIIHNVGTINAIYEAVFEGKALIERFITLSGENLRNPSVIKAKIGTSAQELINFCGGSLENSRFLVGGPMMGKNITNLNGGIFKTSSSLLALPALENFNHLPCIRCAKCAQVCPLNLLPMQFYWFYRANNQQRLKQERIFDCVECGLCGSVCPSKIPLALYFQNAKEEIRREDEKKRFALYAQNRHQNRLKRLEKEAKKREELAQKQREAWEKRTEIKAVEKFNPTAYVENKESQIKAIEEAKRRAAQRRAKRLAEREEKEKGEKND